MRVTGFVALSLAAILLASSGVSAKRLQDAPKRYQSPSNDAATISGECYEQIDLCTSYVQQFETSFRSAPPEYRDQLTGTAYAVEEGCTSCVRQLNLQGPCRAAATKACGRVTRILRGER